MLIPRTQPPPGLYRYRSDCRNAAEYWTRFLLGEPREFLYAVPRRLACRLLGRHNVTCRGRTDHPRRRRP